MVKKHMIKYLKFLRKRSLKLLDVGCGEGYYVKDAVEEGVDAYGNNTHTYSLGNTLDELKDRNIFGSLTEIPFGDEEFDVMTAFDLIEHIHPKDASSMIKEIRTVLKPNGIIIMISPSTSFGGCVFDLTHINVRAPRFWKLIFEDHDLRVKMIHVPSLIKYYMKNHVPIPDFVECLVEEDPFRYALDVITSEKNARLYFVFNKPGQISGD